jgi:glutaminase
VTAPLTANEVAANLAERARELDAATRALDTADRQAVVRREDYTLAYARAFLAADGAMEVRKHRATEQTHAERLAAESAEQVVRGLRRQIDTLRVRIDVGRSMGSAIKAEMALAGGHS